MIRLLVLFFIVLSLAMLPVYAFDRQVMPQLMGLKQVYGNAEATAEKVVQK